jgi:hypothetical protein
MSGDELLLPVASTLDGTEVFRAVRSNGAAVQVPVLAVQAGIDDITATGSTASRTLAARFADSLNVKDFGAAGDNVTNDDAAFQRAATHGGHIYVPPGTYLRTTYTEITLDGTHFYGAGAASIIRMTTMDQPVFVVGSISDATNSPDGVTFSDLAFVQTQTQVDITDTGILGMGATRAAAILKLAGTYLTVENCTFTNHIHGIVYYGDVRVALTGISTGLRVTGCHFEGCNFGVWIEGVKKLRFFDNTCANTTMIQFAGGSLMPPHLLYVVRFEVDSEDLQIANCYEENNTYATTLQIKSAKNVTISGIETRNCCGAVSLFNVRDFAVSNIVTDSSPDNGTALFGAINVFGCARGVVANTSLVLSAACIGVLCTPLPAADSPTGVAIYTTDITLDGIRIDQRAAGTDRPFYMDNVTRVVVREPVIRRVAGPTTYAIYFNNGDGAGGASNMVISPQVFAAVGDAYGHQVVFVESGFTDTRLNLSENLLINIARTTSGIVAGSGAYTLSWDVGTKIITDSSGNVGIGTSAPNRRLELSGASGGAGGTAVPVAVRLSDTANGGSWDTTNPWGAYEFYSSDTSGGTTTGARLRGRLTARMTGSIGSGTNVGLEADGGAGMVRALEVDGLGNTIIGPGTSSIATSATQGFLYVPIMSGTPSGAPGSYGGHVPLVVDSTGSKLWVYVNSTWKSATLA